MTSSARRLLVPGLAAVAVAAACTRDQERTPENRRPNMVVILVDDMRWDEMGAAGHPFIETPNMDRLAREGVRFLNAFATTPLCSPSRASFLTGQYAHTPGIVDNTARPSHDLPIFPVALSAAGYDTAFIGKWHMGNDDSPRPGFTHWVGMQGQGEAIDPVLNIDGERRPTTGYVTDILTDYAVRFIERPRTSPFLVYLAHKAIHPNITQRDDGSLATVTDQPGGFVAAERHRGRYAGQVMPRRPNALGPPAGKPALLRRIDDLPALGLETRTSDEEMRGRLEMLLAVDFHLDTPKEVVIVAPRARGEAEPFLARLRTTFLPNRVLVVAVPGADLAAQARLVPWVEGKVARQGRPTAYVCERRVCRFPTSDPEVFARQLRSMEPQTASP